MVGRVTDELALQVAGRMGLTAINCCNFIKKEKVFVHTNMRVQIIKDGGVKNRCILMVATAEQVDSTFSRCCCEGVHTGIWSEDPQAILTICVLSENFERLEVKREERNTEY